MVGLLPLKRQFAKAGITLHLDDEVEHFLERGALRQAERGIRRCRRCGRPLTDPASIAAGIGPECADQDAAEHRLAEAWPRGAAVRFIDGPFAGREGTIARLRVRNGELRSLMVDCMGETRPFEAFARPSDLELIGGAR